MKKTKEKKFAEDLLEMRTLAIELFARVPGITLIHEKLTGIERSAFRKARNGKTYKNYRLDKSFMLHKMIKGLKDIEAMNPKKE